MITSTGNQRVRELLRLQKKSKARSEAGVFIAEGSRMVLEAPRKRIMQLYISETYEQKHGRELKDGGFCFEVMSDAVFSYVSDTKSPQGILAVVGRREYNIEDIIAGNRPHILLLEELQDPGNLGTIFRTAEAAGVTGILLSRECVDIYNPKVLRSTMGAVYRMPFIYVDDLLKAIAFLKSNKIKVYAAHLDGRHIYDEEDYTGAAAFLIGNEGNGLSEASAGLADVLVKIPMAGKADSLNAAVASAVLMFEVLRQRRKRQADGINSSGKKFKL